MRFEMTKSPMLRVFAIVAVLSLVTITDVAAQSAGAVGRMGFGARGIGLGNALVADASGLGSPFYNPALAPVTERQNVEASVGLMSFDRRMQFLQFAAPMRPRAGIAAGLVHAGVSGIDGRDNSGYHTGELSTDEYALFLAFGVRVSDRASIGLNLQVFRADLYETLPAVNSIGIDLGVLLQPTDALTIGVVLDDLLARYSWDTAGMYGASGRTTSDPFPTRLRAGATYHLPSYQVRLFSEAEARISSRDERRRGNEFIDGEAIGIVDDETISIGSTFGRLGIEWMPRPEFAVRAGMDRLFQDGLEGARPSAGLMFEQPLGNLLIRAEYGAVLEPYDAGLAHLISLRVYL
jgi:hypothetical protein